MICRVCLQDAELVLGIFDDVGLQLNIAETVRQHFWFQPLPDDKMSLHICDDCWCKINEFHEFYQAVERAHRENMKLLDETIKTNDVDHNDEMREENEVLLPSAVDIKVETLEEMPNMLPEPELEPTVLIESVENLKNPLDEAEVIDVSCKTEETSEEEASSKHSDSTMKTHVRMARKRQTRATASAKSIRSKRSMRQPSFAESEAIIKKHIPMGCDLCMFVGESFTDMTKHFRMQHPELKHPYVVCCGRKIKKRYAVVQHAFKHEDPQYFKCHECRKVFSNGAGLRTHVLAHHAPEEELSYACDQCPRKFSRRYMLELHKPSHIPLNERSFFCQKCPETKAFASEHLLQIHTNMCHTKASNICHVCAKKIRDKQAFEKHVRLHFEDSGPRVKCPRPDCDRWLKDKDNLRQHLRRHADEGKSFQCAECGRQCKNRRALASHLKYTHGNKVFTCEQCQKSFKKAISLKEHMAQHTGESLYKCPFCERTFNSNANMHSHKKKMHPLEWDNWRKTKRGSSQKFITSSNSLELVCNSPSAASNDQILGLSVV